MQLTLAVIGKRQAWPGRESPMGFPELAAAEWGGQKRHQRDRFA